MNMTTSLINSFTRSCQVWQHKRSSTPVLVITPENEDYEVGILSKNDKPATISERALINDYNLIGGADLLDWHRAPKKVTDLSDRALRVMEAVAVLTESYANNGLPMPNLVDISLKAGITRNQALTTLLALVRKGLVAHWTIGVSRESYVPSIAGLLALV